MSLPELPPALRALLETGWSLARQAPSARVALARARGVVDPDALPAEVRQSILRHLDGAAADSSQPLDESVVERALREAWGRAPGEVLDSLDSEPLSVRPAAQTHRGVVDGVAVAVRVRRPGLERAVRADLALLDALAAPVHAALPRADARALLRSVREQTLDELDFEHEASTQRRVARAVRDVAGVTVPRAHTELCAENVLVTDLLEGATLADGALPADPGAAARALVAVHLAAARDAGLALVDARPGHVVVLADGSGIGLLGAGVARAVDRARVGRALAAVGSLREGDAAAFAQASSEVLPPAEAHAAFGLARAALGELALGPALLDAAALRGVAERALQLAPGAFDLLGSLTPHPDDLWLARTVGQLAATLARLDAHADWLATTNVPDHPL